MPQAIFFTLCAFAAATLSGCNCRTDEQSSVVVYTALDRGFSEPIFRMFVERTGIEVRAKYDTESTKTLGLVTAIRAEKARPRCDVFWNNEIVNTIRLKRAGLLAAYRSPAAASFPASYRDLEGYWTGFAARARVIVVNTKLVRAGDEPRSIFDLAKPRWRGRVGIAKPLFGTTATHVACLFVKLGEKRAKDFLLALKANDVSIEGGNRMCAAKVAMGELAVALTDTDDAMAEIARGRPVRIVYPDSRPDQIGTLFIPNTVALVRGAPHPKAARRLIDFLLSPTVEIALARCPSAQIPLNPIVKLVPPVKTPRDVHAMDVDFSRAADVFPVAAEFVREQFLR